MMVPKKSALMAGAALLVAGSAFAQSMDHKQHRARADKNFTKASIDLQTGVITRGPKVQQKAGGGFSTVVSLNNLDFAGFVGVDSGPNGFLGPITWISNFDKSAAKAGGQSQFLQNFTFAYCSAVADVNSGGTGAAMTIDFYEGYTPGTAANSNGPSGTMVDSVALTGLPGATGTTGFLGLGFSNCRVVILSVGLGTTPTVLADTAIGYSHTFGDLGSDGTLGGTAIFMGCVQSCSGSGPDGIGGIDNIDAFAPQFPNTYGFSFAFSTVSFPQNRTSVAVSFIEQTPISTAATVIPGMGINNHPITVVSPPILGGSYGTSVDCTGFTPGKFASFRIGFFPGTPFVLGGTKGELLVNIVPGGGLDFLVPDHMGGVAARFAPPVPVDLSFYGFAIEEQAFCGGTWTLGGTPNTNLTTAIGLCAGSF